MIDAGGRMTFGTHTGIGKLFTGVAISPDGIEIWKYGKRKRLNLAPTNKIKQLRAYQRRYVRGAK